MQVKVYRNPQNYKNKKIKERELLTISPKFLNFKYFTKFSLSLPSIVMLSIRIYLYKLLI